MNQHELIKRIYELSTKNPDMKVKIFADNESLLDPSDFAYTVHEFNRVEISLWGTDADRIYVDLDEFAAAVEISHEEAAKRMERVILIYTRAVAE